MLKLVLQLEDCPVGRTWEHEMGSVDFKWTLDAAPPSVTLMKESKDCIIKSYKY